VFKYPDAPLPFIGAADRTSFYQLKTMLQGVVARGTARAIGALSPYVAGKTGTTEDGVDGWFIGFTNDVTIAVWVGYDNGDGKRRSLGTTATGARVALPIFEPILRTIWAEGIAPKAPLSGPSPEAKLHLVDLPIEYYSGNPITGGQRAGQSVGFFGDQVVVQSSGQAFIEHFRVEADGRVNDTQNQLVSRGDAEVVRSPEPVEVQGWGAWGWGARSPSYYTGDGYQDERRQPVARGLFAPWDRGFWGGRPN
jgi:membrane carboxypeptidase/penicillin-binding protein